MNSYQKRYEVELRKQADRVNLRNKLAKEEKTLIRYVYTQGGLGPTIPINVYSEYVQSKLFYHCSVCNIFIHTDDPRIKYCSQEYNTIYGRRMLKNELKHMMKGIFLGNGKDRYSYDT